MLMTLIYCYLAHRFWITASTWHHVRKKSGLWSCFYKIVTKI